MIETRPIAETDHFIVLDQYEKIDQSGAGYQTESDLERELIADLQNQGYEYRKDLNSREKLLANLRESLQNLNNVPFSDSEWQRLRALDLMASGQAKLVICSIEMLQQHLPPREYLEQAAFDLARGAAFDTADLSL